MFRPHENPLIQLLSLMLLLSAGSGMAIVIAIGWTPITLLPTGLICAGLGLLDLLMDGNNYRF